MGRACLVINLSYQETKCRRDHEGSLAEVWQELLHQVRNDHVECLMKCKLEYHLPVVKKSYFYLSVMVL